MKTISSIRKLSTSAAASIVKPPIPFFGVSGRYLNALYSAAYKQKKLDAVENDLKNITSVIEKNQNFIEFISNPLINVSEKKTILSKISNEKFKFNELTINTLNLLAENRRLTILSSLAKGFSQIMTQIRNELTCTIYTAKTINDATIKKQIEDALRGFTSKKIFFNYKLDSSIMGGIVVDFGNSYIDMSISSKLKTYSKILEESV